MAEALCRICPISAARVLRRAEAGVIAVPAETLRPGHVMVVSAVHARSFEDLKPVEADAFMALVAAAARAAEQASGAERYYVMRIGDKTPHLHFHLVPRVEGEPSLAPFVFGDAGWARQIRPDATPPAELFDKAFIGALRLEAVQHRTREDAGRLPAWLASGAISLLAGLAVMLAAWPAGAGTYTASLGIGAAAATNTLLSDRMRGHRVRWGVAALIGATMGSVAVLARLALAR